MASNLTSGSSQMLWVFDAVQFLPKIGVHFPLRFFRFCWMTKGAITDRAFPYCRYPVSMGLGRRGPSWLPAFASKKGFSALAEKPFLNDGLS